MFPTRQAASVSVSYIYIACIACYTFCHVQETGAKVCVRACVCVCVCVYRRGSWSLRNCRLSRMMKQCQDEVCVSVCVCVCVYVCASFECHLGSAPGLGFFLPSVGDAFMSAKCVYVCVCVCVCVNVCTLVQSEPLASLSHGGFG